MIKPVLLVLYDYFYPGYKAGGPIQSLTNLAVALAHDYNVYVITSSHDLTSHDTYSNIKVNKWTEVSLPGSNNVTNVYYADKNLDKRTYLNLFNEIKPTILYLNNIYSYSFFRLPLQACKRGEGYKYIICPRGMLHHGALAIKPFKKKVYFAYLRLSGLMNQVHWHATNVEEARDIKRIFPKNKGIIVAPNIPKIPIKDIFYSEKVQGQLRLIYLSLIAEKKYVLLLLQVMLTVNKNITLDIYGPITDENYWRQCQELIQQMPEKVQYKGDVQPAEVQNVMSQYHAFISLTKGENFGHALYESLSVGRPVITSHFTPWNNLQQQYAGVNVDISDKNDCLKKLQEFANLNQDEYTQYCNGAHHLATKYYQELDAVSKYRELFG